MLEFQMFLIHTAEGCSVHGKVTRGIRAEEVHLRHFRMVTHLENGLLWNYEDLDAFCRHENCRHKVSIDILWTCAAMMWCPGNRLADGVASFYLMWPIYRTAIEVEDKASGREKSTCARVEEHLQTDCSVTISVYDILLLVYCMAMYNSSWCMWYSTAAPVLDGCFVRSQTIQLQNCWPI
jgi:hypothetical protein